MEGRGLLEGGYFDGMGCRGEVGVCRVEREFVEGRRSTLRGGGVHRGDGSM